MDFNGNLTTSRFLSSLANTNSLNRVNTQNSSLVEERAEQPDTPSRIIRPLTEIASKVRDVNDGVTLFNSLEAGYRSLIARIQNLGELALAATNTELTESDRFNLNSQAMSLIESLNQEVIDFKGTTVSDQGENPLTIQIVASDQGDIKLSALDAESLFVTAGLTEFDLSTTENANRAVTIVETLQEGVQSVSDGIDQSAARLESFIADLSFTEKEAQNTVSSSFDAVIARDIASLIQEQLKRDNSVFLQLDPNTDRRMVLGLITS